MLHCTGKLLGLVLHVGPVAGGVLQDTHSGAVPAVVAGAQLVQAVASGAASLLGPGRRGGLGPTKSQQLDQGIGVTGVRQQCESTRVVDQVLVEEPAHVIVTWPDHMLSLAGVAEPLPESGVRELLAGGRSHDEEIVTVVCNPDLRLLVVERARNARELLETRFLPDQAHLTLEQLAGDTRAVERTV